MKEIGHAIAELTDRLDDLDQRIAIAFKQLKGRVSTLEARVDGRMDQLESETKIDRIGQHFAEYEARRPIPGGGQHGSGRMDKHGHTQGVTG